MNITLYGAASDRIDHVYIKSVEKLGAAIAKEGHTLVFGGGATGLMGAAARGVHKEGGRIVGIVPRFMEDFEPVFPHCTELVYTDTMAQRKDEMEERADAFLIVPGGVGTFDEFFQILTLKTLKRHQKPIILYNIHAFWDNMLAVLGTDIFKRFISTSIFESFSVCETEESIFELLNATQK
ncbi:MAG: TIGR00730 family Rossman fold protein [Clostridia bacterium]|nr:TIGR00730 family Rossman fold protein [Clostridia bacterium]